MANDDQKTLASRLDAVAPGAANDDGGLVLSPIGETRLARSAGRMAEGARMAIPPSLGSSQVRNRALVPMVLPEAAVTPPPRMPRAALATFCAVTLGSTAALTALIGLGERFRSAPSTGATSPGTIQVLAVASPMAVAPPSANRQNSTFVRVAQRDGGLQAANVFGPAGKAIPMKVGLAGGNEEDYSFLMFRGLPPKVMLSAGFRLKESWAVSLRDLDNLTIEAPADFQGAFNLEILLVKGRDTPAESRVITVQIVPSDLQIPATAGLGQPVQMQPAPGPQVLTAAPRTPDAERPVQRRQQQQAPAARLTIPASEEATMMQRAETLLQNKDVSSARLLFEHLAKNGSARAALAMGKTYDPSFLATIAAGGLKPDQEKARTWYRHAAELGDQEAQTRLSSLGR